MPTLEQEIDELFSDYTQTSKDINQEIDSLLQEVAPRQPSVTNQERRDNNKYRLLSASAELGAQASEGYSKSSDRVRLELLNRQRENIGLYPLDEVPQSQTVKEWTQKDLLGEGGLEERTPIKGSVKQAFKLYEVYKAAQNAEEGQSSDSDMELLANYLEDQAKEGRGRSWGAGVLDMISRLPGFGIEFAASGVIAGGIKKTGRKIAKETAEKAIGKTITRQVGAMIGETALRLPAFSATIAADTIRNLIPGYQFSEDELEQLDMVINKQGDNFLEALSKATGNMAIEVFSEQTGKILRRAGKAIKGKVLRVPTEKVGELKAGTLGSLMAKRGKKLQSALNVLEKGGYHGALEEIGEERIGDLLRLIVPGQEGGQLYPSMDQLSQEAVAFSVPGLAAKGYARTTFRAKPIPDPVEYVQTDPESARTFAEKEKPTRKDARKAGLSGLENDQQRGEYAEALRLTLNAKEQGEKDAAQIRSDTGQLGGPRGALERGQEGRRPDLQQAAEVQPEARPPVLPQEKAPEGESVRERAVI
jgi:hypothetical protein